jgi:hypothetical protein
VTIRFKRNVSGFNALRTSAAVDGLIREKAESIEAAANAIPPTTSPPPEEPYYEAKEAGDAKRARYRVVTANIRAQRHEVKTQALLRGLSSGG